MTAAGGRRAANRGRPPPLPRSRGRVPQARDPGARRSRPSSSTARIPRRARRAGRVGHRGVPALRPDRARRDRGGDRRPRPRSRPGRGPRRRGPPRGPGGRSRPGAVRRPAAMRRAPRTGRRGPGDRHRRGDAARTAGSPPIRAARSEGVRRSEGRVRSSTSSAPIDGIARIEAGPWSRDRRGGGDRLLGGRQEALEIAEPIAAVAPRVDAVEAKPSLVAPRPDRVRVDAQEACRLRDGERRVGRPRCKLRSPAPWRSRFPPTGRPGCRAPVGNGGSVRLSGGVSVTSQFLPIGRRSRWRRCRPRSGTRPTPSARDRPTADGSPHARRGRCPRASRRVRSMRGVPREGVLPAVGQADGDERGCHGDDARSPPRPAPRTAGRRRGPALPGRSARRRRTRARPSGRQPARSPPRRRARRSR